MGKVNLGSEFFSGNRSRLRELFSGTAPIVITSNGLMQRNADVNFPFEQDSNFFYLTGIDEPDSLLVMDKGKEYLIIPKKDPIHKYFEGEAPTQQISKISGIETIYDHDAGWKQLSSRLKKVKHVATIAAPAAYIDAYKMYSNPAKAQLIKRIKEINSGAELLDIRPHMIKLRMIKQEVELMCINEAIDITISTLRQVATTSRLSRYEYEYQLVASINEGFQRRGATGMAFDSIVASGMNGTIIHNFNNNFKLKRSDLVTIDVGAQVNHYAADITRTFSIGGRPSPRQKAVYQAVLDTQNFGIEHLKPGISLRDHEKLCEQFIGEKMRELNLIKSITPESVRHYYPHYPHFLGLDVHDAGDYEVPLAPGMVVTCEPGIYIAEEGIGVRIEDDILISDNGPEVLTRRLPRSLN